MEVSSDEGQVGKGPNTIDVHDSGVKEHDTSSTSGHSCVDNVDRVDEESTRTDHSLTNKTVLPCVLENVPNNDDALESPIPVDGVQTEVENLVENHQMTYTEGATPAVSTKDADEGISRSAKELHEVPDKDRVISSLEEEVSHLKAKLAELERQSDSVIQSISSVQSHQDKDANDTVSLVSGKLNIGQGSTSQSYRPRIRYTKLNFKVDTFFAVGSPLGVFLSLRNVRIGVGM
ncbi:hypothetical protein ACQJBY_068881 [Aegilops geniculata]